MRDQDSRQRQSRNRAILVVICVIFFGGMLVAGLLRFSGWQPQGMKNNGEMLQPYVDLRKHAATLASGDGYRWSDSPRTWRIVAAPRECGGQRSVQCASLLRQLDTVWRLMGKDADRVHVLWLGDAPRGMVLPGEVRLLRADDVLSAQLPGLGDTRGDPAWLIDPNGFVVLRYAPGFDPGDLRTDLARLLKVN